MKRTWSKLGFLCLIGLCISCSSEIITDDAVQPTEQAISWVPYIAREVQTRAVVMDLTQLQNNGFGIMGYVHTGTPNYATPNFMNGPVTWDSSNSQWSYSPTKYWPNNASQQLDFLAYAPYGDDTHINVSGSTLTFTVDDNAENQVDLIVATAKNQTRSNNNGAVELNFRHLLSRLQFDAKAAAGSTSTITINVTLTGDFYTQGTVDLSQDSPQIAGQSKNSQTYTVNSSSTYLMLMPDADFDATFTVSYTITYSDNSTENGTYNGTLSTANLPSGLAGGKAYRVILTVATDEILFDVESVTEWGKETINENP